MSRANRWLLPDGVKEVLPPEARSYRGPSPHCGGLISSVGLRLSDAAAY